MRLGGPHDPVLADATLLGGQAFRWRRDGDAFAGVVGNRQWRVSAAGDGAVDVSVHPRLPRAHVERYLGLGDAGYVTALDEFARDPYLAPAVRAYRGLRVLRQDPWEALVAFVTSANNNVARIALTMERLSAAAGERVDAPAGAFHAFPTPEAVAALDEAALRGLGFGYRAPFVRGVARAVAAGGLDLARLADARTDLDAARDALVALPGVGPKVAACVALFALGKTDAFPVDRWVVRAASEAWFRGEDVRPGDVEALARERWGERAGLAQQFLFHAARMRGVQRGRAGATGPRAQARNE